jgi:hypothetical protein
MSPPGCTATPPDQEGRRCLKPDVATPPGPTSPSRTPCFLFTELFAASPGRQGAGLLHKGDADVEAMDRAALLLLQQAEPRSSSSTPPRHFAAVSGDAR